MISQNLTLNGTRYSPTQLLAKADKLLASPTTPTWQRELWTFIQAWLSDSPDVIVQTSGSTGKPKPIRIRKEQMINSALATGRYFGLSPNDRALLCLPCRYIAGRMMVVRAFVWQLNLITMPPSGNPVANIKDKIAFAAMVPLQVAQALGESPLQLQYIQTLIIGGAAVNSILYQQLQNISTACYASYGMTETVTHIALKRLNGNQPPPYYEALPQVTLSTDERGCLVIDAPLVADNVVITNDRVQLSASARTFEWLGRYDNVINSGGVKIQPEVVEQKIADSLDGRFFIIGMPHDTLGEQVTLVLESSPLSPIEKTALLHRIRPLLERFEMPKEVRCVAKFEETETGKVKRGASLGLL